MLKLILSLSFLTPLFSFGAFEATLKLSKVLDLETLETYDTHLVHMERVWEGQVKFGSVPTPRINIFKLDGKLDGQIELTYTPTHIFTHGPSAVVVTGKINGADFKTPFTKIVIKNGKYIAKTTVFQGDYHVDHFVGDGKRELFALFADRALYGNLNGPWSVINTEEVIGPHHMVLFDNFVYVLNNHNIAAAGFETISKVDLTTGKVKIVSGDKYLQGVHNFYYHKKSGLIVFPEFLLNQVTLFDPKTDSVVGKLSVEDPRGLAAYGNCLAISSEDKRFVSYFDLSKTERPLISTWDLSPLGNTFKKARNIGIDERSGKLFARSTYLCTGCSETMSSVVMAEETNGATKKACFGKVQQQ